MNLLEAAVIVEEMNLCSYQTPDPALIAIRDFLRGRSARSYTPEPDALYCLCAALCDRPDLIEWGTSVRGCWLEPKGVEFLAFIDDDARMNRLGEVGVAYHPILGRREDDSPWYVFDIDTGEEVKE